MSRHGVLKRMKTEFVESPHIRLAKRGRNIMVRYSLMHE
ncbi:hypothetical protein HM1_1218 [Heliomicrobium modesticaldum Ice1]|uniref:Uncharacterized protein n=1 Tax=Heliobacterium modesticaldum (strain ATCC 51547 / Ice1) TaxID=498761 RepID=B0TH31_HELMI|nr:hypothetical protein HM1_1218 [Heliomicrobium modesticaldum Ice1]